MENVECTRGPRVAHGRIGRIIEWYVTVLCRFARNVGAVSELMAAGQMFRGFSAELSYPRAQHNARRPYTCMCVRAAKGYTYTVSRARMSHT